MTTTHRAKRIADGEYEYRGYTITRDDNVSDGYWGRWKTGGRVNCSGTTLRDVKANIDRKIQEQEARNAAPDQPDTPVEVVEVTKVRATVTRATIEANQPCAEGLANFIDVYGHLDPDAPVSLIDCLSSNSVSDVFWALRAVQEDISSVLPLLAADIAESVLVFYEGWKPGDDRPRKAIAAARTAAYAAADAEREKQADILRKYFKE